MTTPTPEALRAELAWLNSETGRDSWRFPGYSLRRRLREQRRAEIRAKLAEIEAAGGEEPDPEDARCEHGYLCNPHCHCPHGCGLVEDPTPSPKAPASEERTDRCEGGDHTIGDRIGCEDCTLHTIKATRYWHNMRSVLRLYVESCVDRAQRAQIEAQGTLCRMLNEERDSHTTTREQRKAAEAEAAWIRNQLHSAQAAMDSSRSQHTATREALRELVEAVARLQQATTETTVNAGYIWQDRYRDLIQTLTRARALLEE